LADELPIVFLRVRKAWFNRGTKVVVAHDALTDVDSFAHVVLRYRPGTGHILAQGLLSNVTGQSLGITPEEVEVQTGVPAARVKEAAEVLSGAAVLTTRGLYDAADGPAAAETLRALADATGGRFSSFARLANEEGAALLGILPADGGLDTHAILQACAKGKVKALWLVGVDPFVRYPDRRLVQAALEKVDFLAYQHHTETEALHYASVVLPMAAPTESEGSYTNVERRVQHLPRVLAPKGEAKPAWRVFADLSVRLRAQTPAFNVSEVFDLVAAQVPAFAGASYARLSDGGLLLGVREPAAV
jgi:NADH-quinone oxidoreductase subunit G